MRLNIFTDYCLRVLIYLAVSSGRLTTRHEIATAYRISDNHLMKVVNFLARNGYIETVRGKNGGMRLAHIPEKIVIGEVVHDCEADIPLVVCFADKRKTKKEACRLVGQCELQHVLQQGVKAMYHTLNQYTLADAIADREAMQQRLGIKADAVLA